MRKIILILIFGLISFASAMSGPIDDFRAANKLYTDGKYDKAAEAYEKLIVEGYKNSDVYYNLGNSYYRLKQYPRAILSYERAHRLAPSDDDISFNLKLADLQIVDKFDPIPRIFIVNWYYDFIDMFYSGTWAVIIIMAAFILFASLAAFLWFGAGRIRRISFSVAIISVIILAMGFIFGYQSYQLETSQSYGIIMSTSVYVKSSPDNGSTDLFLLHEGTKVHLLDVVGDWREIKVENGNVGWVPKNSFEII